jgi:hypothetical protein
VTVLAAVAAVSDVPRRHSDTVTQMQLPSARD